MEMIRQKKDDDNKKREWQQRRGERNKKTGNERNGKDSKQLKKYGNTTKERI